MLRSGCDSFLKGFRSRSKVKVKIELKVKFTELAITLHRIVRYFKLGSYFSL